MYMKYNILYLIHFVKYIASKTRAFYIWNSSASNHYEAVIPVLN